MAARLLLAVTLSVGIAAAGCAPAPRVNTVPWWKGIPLMVIEPTSLEGMVWRDYLHNRRSPSAAGPVVVSNEVIPAEPDFQGQEYETPDGGAALTVPDPEAATNE